MRLHYKQVIKLLLPCALALVACGNEIAVKPTQQSGAWQWQLPSYFPQPAEPSTNAMSPAKVELGRFLFYDPRLSGAGNQSCASCHHQDKAFTDGKVVSVGSTGEHLLRNAQGLANVAYMPTLTWANPSLVSLEAQMQVPLFGDNPVEMGINDHNKVEVLSRIQNDAQYKTLFSDAYPSDNSPITYNNIVRAIASFQRSLISANSTYDQMLAGKVQFTAAQKRGMDLFNSEKAECFHCHGSFNFNDQVKHATTRALETPFHNTGLYNLDAQTGAYPEFYRGVFELSARAEDMGKFKAPSLRNVALTAPYFHDGTAASLEQVLQSYAAGGRNIVDGPFKGDGRSNKYKDPLIVSIALTEQDQADIIEFLRTLTDEEFINNPKHSNPFAK